MAMRDWNGNGRNDAGDDYIEYRIYNEVMNDGDDDDTPSYSGSSSNDGCGCGMWLIVFFILYIIGQFFS